MFTPVSRQAGVFSFPRSELRAHRFGNRPRTRDFDSPGRCAGTYFPRGGAQCSIGSSMSSPAAALTASAAPNTHMPWRSRRNTMHWWLAALAALIILDPDCGRWIIRRMRECSRSTR